MLALQPHPKRCLIGLGVCLSAAVACSGGDETSQGPSVAEPEMEATVNQMDPAPPQPTGSQQAELPSSPVATTAVSQSPSPSTPIVNEPAPTEQPACEGPAPAPLEQFEVVNLNLAVSTGSEPLELGVRQPLKGSTTELLLDALMFYLAEPAAVTADGQRAAAQWLTVDHNPAPYGVHLVDLDDPASLKLRLAVPPGDYQTFEFGLGVPARCNDLDAAANIPPLNADSIMYWGWGAQFKFALLVGHAFPEGQAEPNPLVIHMGTNLLYRTLSTPAALAVPAPAGANAELLLDVSVLLEGIVQVSHMSFGQEMIANIDRRSPFFWVTPQQ